jgi:galactose-1-phosphate uridylyltransferase
MSVIFGNNGLNDMTEVYDLLHRKIMECNKTSVSYFCLLYQAHLENWSISWAKVMLISPMRLFLEEPNKNLKYSISS